MTQTKQPIILQIQPKNKDAVARQTADALSKGSLVILPTETVYGLAADPRIPGAEEKIFTAKSRDKNKQIPLLAANINAVKESGGKMNNLERKLAEKFWPGPLTLVLETTKPQKTEGFRVPDNETTLAILTLAGGLLRVTSANISGDPPARTVQEALQDLSDFIEIAVDNGPTPDRTPSTVVKIEGDKINILRAGALSESQLLEAAAE